MKDITKEITEKLRSKEVSRNTRKPKKAKGICECERCSYAWKPRSKKLPTICPNCKSKYWNVERTFLDCALCEHRWQKKTKQMPIECPKCGSENWDNNEMRELNIAIHWLDNKIREKEEAEIRTKE